MLEFDIEDLHSGANRIRTRISTRIARPGVVLTEATHDWSSPIRSPDQTIVFTDSARSGRTTGPPLLIGAHCEDASTWPVVSEAFRNEGFEAFGPRSELGDQCYKSTTRALFVVAVHP